MCNEDAGQIEIVVLVSGGEVSGGVIGIDVGN